MSLQFCSIQVKHPNIYCADTTSLKKSPSMGDMFPSVKALLTAMVDYAGVFPPAKLSVKDAMTQFAQAASGHYAGMLNRFVLPAACLEEFVALQEHFPETEWRLSVTLTGDVAIALQQLQHHRHTIALTALEIPPLPPQELAALLSDVPEGIDLFFEMPVDQIEAYLSVIWGTPAMAKIRTGGVTVDAFPSAQQIARAIQTFAQAGIPFKATAGLHHALRSQHPLTYESNSLSAWMHGFLNVAIAAAFLYHHKISLKQAQLILETSKSDSFLFKPEAIAWSGLTLTTSEIHSARHRGFRSFGSCSFKEPVYDLTQLRLL